MPHKKLILDQLREIIPIKMAEEIKNHNVSRECIDSYLELLRLLSDNTEKLDERIQGKI